MIEIQHCAKMKFSIKDFFIKCDQIRTFPADLVTFTNEIRMENFIFAQCKHLIWFLRLDNNCNSTCTFHHLYKRKTWIKVGIDNKKNLLRLKDQKYHIICLTTFLWSEVKHINSINFWYFCISLTSYAINNIDFNVFIYTLTLHAFS